MAQGSVIAEFDFPAPNFIELCLHVHLYIGVYTVHNCMFKLSAIYHLNMCVCVGEGVG